MADRIALVDDDQNILTSVALALESEGFEVDSYSDSEAALASRLHRPIDLTLTQFRVGTGAEAEAIELLRAREDSQRALSEESRSLAERMALIAGVDPGEVTSVLRVTTWPENGSS